VQHGQIVVIDPNLTDGQVLNLAREFQPTDYPDITDHNAAADICRKICYSLLYCQYWQYYHGHGSNDGCWVEKYPSNRVQNPLIRGNAGDSDVGYVRHSQQSVSAIAGEFIVHHCPIPTRPGHTPPTTTTTTTLAEVIANQIVEPEPSNWFWPWGALAAGLAVVLGLVGAALMMSSQKSPPKKRAVKPVKAKEPPPPPPPPAVPLVPQYTSVILQPTVAQPLAMAQPPVATYAAPASAYMQPGIGAAPVRYA
jgi:hypothetical protein